MSEQGLVLKEESCTNSNIEFVYQFGEFILDPQSQSLLCDGKEITIEPKVLDVLLYFCQHANRNILLQELHDNVWQGRIVSDAAVRRSISKLRTILSANSDSQYLQSQHKRGYKLTVEVQRQQVSNNSHSQIDEIFPLESFNNKKQSLAIPNKRFVILVILLLTIFTAYLFVPFTISTEKNIEFPGEKVHIATNGNLVAFAGKVFDFQSNQVFVSDLNSNKVRQITENEQNVVWLDFSHDGKFIYYIDLSLGNSKLKRFALEDDSENDVEILIDNFFFLSDFSVNQSGEKLYFCGIKTQGEQSQVYYFDIKNKSLTNITSHHGDGMHDYRTSISKDGSLLAVGTSLGREQEQKITIFNTHNHSVYKRIIHEFPIFDLEWGERNTLNILDKHEFTELELLSGNRNKLLDNDEHKLVAIDRIDEDSFIALKKSTQNNIYIEISIPSFSLNSQRVVNKVDSEIEQMKYSSDENAFLVVRKSEEHYSLIKRVKEKSVEQLLLKTAMPMKIIDSTKNDNDVLLYIDGLLAVFNIETSQINYISKGNDHVYLDAEFSLDEKFIYYGVQSGNGWKLFKYDIKLKRSELSLVDFKSIHQTTHGDYLLNGIGQLYYRSNSDNIIQSLKDTVDTAITSQWFVRDKYILWSEFNGKNTAFYVFDLEHSELKIHHFNKSHITMELDINIDGSNALLIRQQLPETDILKISLPAF